MTSPITKSSKYLSIIFFAVLSIVGLLFGVLCGLTPPGADDLLFLTGVDPSSESFSVLCDKLSSACELRWTTETGRLGVFMSLGFLFLLPKWVFGLLLAAAIVILIRYICKLASVEPGSVLSWLILASIVFVAPWYDFMFQISYAMNYVIGGAMTVTAVYFFLNIERYKGWQLAGIFILMFSAGWIHEAYSAPFGIAATIWMIHKRKFTPKTVTAWICLGLGAFIIAISPTLWHRAGDEMLITKFPLKEAVMQLGPSTLFAGMFILISVMTLCTKKVRSKITNRDKWLFMAVYVAVSLLVLITFYCGPRTGFPTILFSTVGIAYLAQYYLPKHIRKIVYPVALTVSVICIAHLIYSCYAEWKLRGEYYEIVDLYKKSDNGTFYYDLTYPKPDFSLYKTSVRDFHSREPMYMWENYYDSSKHLVILPTALAGFSEEKARRSKYTDGVMIYNGWTVITEDCEMTDRIYIHTEDGRKLSTRYRIDEFDIDGKHYKLIVPHVKVLDQTIMITDIEL